MMKQGCRMLAVVGVAMLVQKATAMHNVALKPGKSVLTAAETVGVAENGIILETQSLIQKGKKKENLPDVAVQFKHIIKYWDSYIPLVNKLKDLRDKKQRNPNRDDFHQGTINTNVKALAKNLDLCIQVATMSDDEAKALKEIINDDESSCSDLWNAKLKREASVVQPGPVERHFKKCRDYATRLDQERSDFTHTNLMECWKECTSYTNNIMTGKNPKETYKRQLDYLSICTEYVEKLEKTDHPVNSQTTHDQLMKYWTDCNELVTYLQKKRFEHGRKYEVTTRIKGNKIYKTLTNGSISNGKGDINKGSVVQLVGIDIDEGKSKHVGKIKLKVKIITLKGKKGYREGEEVVAINLSQMENLKPEGTRRRLSTMERLVKEFHRAHRA